MKTTSVRARALSCALLAGTALCGLTTGDAASAQEASVVAFPVRQFADENGVDLLSGVFTVSSPSVSIGSPGMGLTYIRAIRAGGYRDSMMGTIDISGSTYTVDIGGSSEKFTAIGGGLTPVEQNGSTLGLSGGVYTYRNADGVTATFTSTTRNFGNARGMVITSLVYPSGRSLTFHYTEATLESVQGTKIGRRLQSVTTNAGYHLKFTYAADVPSGLWGGNWLWLTQVKGLNSSVDSCDVSAFSCPQTGRPQLTVPTAAYGLLNYVDSEGRTTGYTVSNNLVTGVRFAGSAGDDVAIAYASGKVSSVTSRGVTTSYAYSDLNGVRTVTVTRPGTPSRVVTFDIAKSVKLSDQDELGRTTSYQYDTNNRVTRVTQPEGNYTAFAYDPRGNVVETRSVAKPGSGLPDIVETASYDPSCTSGVKCNKPNSVTDARGNVTAFTYDTVHGGLLTATAPAVGGISPQTRISYSRLDSSGAPSATGIVVPTGTSACQTAAACTGGADEVKTTTAYGQGLQPSSVSAGSGDGALIATSTMTYDVVGNLLTVDGPLSGPADTVRHRYNLNRERIGTVSPDPDGAGPLKHRASRTTIDPATGLATREESGTVNSQSDSDWAAFAPLEAVDTGYDSYRRPVTSKLTAGGAVHALTQTGYDALGRAECVAQRMNPAAFGALPASACSLGPLGTGLQAHGPDRITRTFYDPTGRVTEVRTALGTADEASEVRQDYTPNGLVLWVMDGEGNKTHYQYDGHDRLWRTHFPMPSPKGSATSNANDFEQLDYEVLAGGTSNLVVAFRNRAGQSIGFGYDALGRMVSKVRPAPEPNVAYGYDLLGRLTSASQPGHALVFTYDALGRVLNQTGPLGTVASEWDPAGRRTKLTWPDTFHVTYDHLVTGEVVRIRENGAASGIGVLATFGYDDFGRRVSLTRGNGVVTDYRYDAASRLDQLKLDFAGTTDDFTAAFTHNPAGQIASTTRSNDAYAWTGHGSGTISAQANGLNQLSNWTSTLAHDAKGNVTTDGTYGYGYSSENLLTQLTNSAPSAIQAWSTYAYDPLMRLAAIDSSNPQLDAGLAHDGQEIVVETLSNGRTRRYLRGPGTDEPLVAYLVTPTGTSRSWYSADERGSTLRQTNDAGAPQGGLGRYDEYGVGPGTSRFQYTGQYWLGDRNLHYYRARVYDPRLGRFLQPDPIGYGDGMNLYAYVGGDPVNFTDPLGLQEEDIIITGTRLRKKKPKASPDGSSGVIRWGGGPRFYGSGGGKRGPHTPPTSPDEEDAWDEYLQDRAICARLKTASAREACFRSASERYSARLANRPVPDLVTWGRTAAAVATAGVILYWIISVGSRIFFPPRNLVPIP